MEKSFNCPQCEMKMIARLGQKRAHHFMHDGHPCGLESYTHKIGKLIFYLRYKKALKNGFPVVIHADVPVNCDHCSIGPCLLEYNSKTMDLTNRYNKISLETKSAENLIPDILLTDKDGKQIFVEIHVTSPCSQEKLDSGNPIIEFHLEGPTDFYLLQSAEPLRNGKKISFHNFPWIRKKATEKECGNELQNVFIVYPSRKCYLPERGSFLKPSELPKGTYLQPIQYADILMHNELNVRESERAFHFGVAIANCFLCHHHIPEALLNKVYCKIDSYEDKKHSAAANCSKYRPDQNKFHFRNISSQQIEDHNGKMDELYQSGQMSKLMAEFYKNGALSIMAKRFLESGMIKEIDGIK